MKTDETNPDHWFELAAGRLRSADRLFAAEGASLAAVEQLYEAAERYLRGFLIRERSGTPHCPTLTPLPDGSEAPPGFGAHGTIAPPAIRIS